MTDRRRLRSDALDIWQCAVTAVRADRVVGAALEVARGGIAVYGERFALDDDARIFVAGGGKAAAAMAAAVENKVAGTEWFGRLDGWVNVPDDATTTLERIHVHAARPAGVNFPTAEAIDGTREIVARIGRLRAQDVCIFLLSGGGSALLCWPARGVSLDDKVGLTRRLFDHGSTIQEINLVRKHLSRVKNGRLGAASAAGRNVALIISDVIGDDPCDIAAGPTCPDARQLDPLDVIDRRLGGRDRVPGDILRALAVREPLPAARVSNHIIASNATAVDAAIARAEHLGCRTVSLGPGNDGDTVAAARNFVRQCLDLQRRLGPSDRPLCLVRGGETTMTIPRNITPGKGGRNQHFVLAAAARLREERARRVCLLSGGTDGEDGPTDAAGAVIDDASLSGNGHLDREIRRHLETFDAYPFLARHECLIRSGPTHTNVADIQVALVEPVKAGPRAGILPAPQA
jgi:glycerate 2-kinase